MSVEFTPVAPYSQIIYPFKVGLGELLLWEHGKAQLIKEWVNLLFDEYSELFTALACPVIAKEKGLKRMNNLLSGERTSDFGLNYTGSCLQVSNIEEFKSSNLWVWYLDMPNPIQDISKPIIKNKYLPTEFPLMMPVSPSIVWKIDDWSDYLFSSLWFSLFEPYFAPGQPPMCEIGVNCRISNMATLVPPYTIGNHVTIEAGAIVAGSIVGDYSRIGQGCIVRNSILSEGVSLPMGVIILMSVINAGCVINSQLRFSVIDTDVFVGGNVSITDMVLGANQQDYHYKRKITIREEGTQRKSMAAVLGCAIGKNSRIASNVLLRPGETIEPNTRLLPK